MSLSHTVISSLAALVAGGSVAIVAGATNPQSAADIASIPWDKLLGVGSGGLAFGVAWYFLQREERMRKAHDDTMQKHMETTQTISKTFAETTHSMVREVREESAAREARMLQMMAKTHQ
ncbi:MAG: hypothetical protein ACK52I_06975 [Pseudomonadota bacterium]|jgi:hypothetical protein